MLERSRVGRVLAPAIGLVVLIYAPKVLWPHALVYERVLTELVLSVVASALKLASLGGGAVLAARSASRLEHENPARRAWWTFSAFLACFFVGQLVLSSYQLVLRVATPVPSLGDVFFVLGYVLLIVATARFVQVYRASGFPVGRRHEHLAIAVASIAIFTVIGAALLSPIYAAQKPLAERLINLAYPILDFVTLVFVIVLLRIAYSFRGGRVFYVWTTLVVGLAFASGGDILFAYWSSVGYGTLEPLVDALLIASYLFLAGGAALQRELVG